MINNLLWQKYSPKKIDDLILLPRIKKVIGDGTEINGHLLLFGHFGTGKSTLAKILTKGKPTLYSNTSIETSIDVLRGSIQNHVDTMSDVFHSTDTFKYVFLDEFEQASSKYQDGLKAFIDDYSDTVRFIFVTNHIHKVQKGIISRCTELDFDPATEDEMKWWKTQCKNKLIEIAKIEEIEVEEIDVKRVVNHNFPDLRKMITVLSNINLTGITDYSIVAFDKNLKVKLHSLLKNGTIVDLQQFVMENFGPEKAQEVLNLCGRPLIETLIESEKDIIKTEKLGDIFSLVAEHSMWLNTIKGGDPVIVAVSCLSNIKKILK